jgi:serine/threonine-protein kinase
MVSTVSCQHCGEEHAADARRCPRTGEVMSDPGPCGAKIDRYEVRKLLGVGGFGAVYLAVHTRTGAEVALKVLRRERADDAAAVERFMREARAAALLGSEHITRVLDAEVSAEGLPFIAMELLEGTDLSELDKAKGPIHPERLVNIMIQALSALQVAHDKGIVHRDMKPANIFITKRKDVHGAEHDFVKLLDFGISKMQVHGEKALTLAGTTMGTPAYMAYEQFFDARSVDGRADVYSVCAILYEQLSRRRPFIASNYGELVMKVEKETPPPLKEVAPTLPESLCAVVDQGLKKDRQERWQSARELADALARVGSLRGVVLKTEIAMAAAGVELSETRAHVSTAEPRHKEGLRSSSRGEVKTVLMDASLDDPEALVPTAPRPALVPAPPGAVVGNDTVLMDPSLVATPIGTVPVTRTTGNKTVVIDPSVGVVPQSREPEPVGNQTVRLSREQERTTDPAAPQRRLTGPRDSASHAALQQPSPGGPFGLGWMLVGALGAGAAIVIAMLIWVITLARRH